MPLPAGPRSCGRWASPNIHTAVENVLSLCNLALLTGHVGRRGSGLVPLRGQNNVQGGGDMGALPDRLPGFQPLADPQARAKFEKTWDCELNPVPGKHLTLMFEAMEEGELRALYVIGENPADSEANVAHARKLLEGLDLLIVQDISMTRTAAHGRRGPACGSGLVIQRGDGDVLRTPCPAGASCCAAPR